jgi:regulator of protease activity HflC (stomatin/prohibitin superfamily)
MKRWIAGIVVLAALAAGVLALMSCASEDNAAARRANAEAALVRAQGQADADRERARADAEASRASVRQMEKDAAHQRTVELLPFVVIIVGGLGVALVVFLVFWDLRSRPVATGGADPALLLYLRRQELDQAQQWRALAHLAREVDNGREVIIYPDDGRQ